MHVPFPSTHTTTPHTAMAAARNGYRFAYCGAPLAPSASRGLALAGMTPTRCPRLVGMPTPERPPKTYGEGSWLYGETWRPRWEVVKASSSSLLKQNDAR